MMMTMMIMKLVVLVMMTTIYVITYLYSHQVQNNKREENKKIHTD